MAAKERKNDESKHVGGRENVGEGAVYRRSGNWSGNEQVGNLFHFHCVIDASDSPAMSAVCHGLSFP